MTKTETIAKQNPVEIPLYTFLDVARYLRVPSWVALALSGRHRFHPIDWSLFAARFADDDALPLRKEEPQRISFRSLAALFVRSFLFHVPPKRDRLAQWHLTDGMHLFDTAWDAFQRAESEPSLFTDPDLILNQFKSEVIRFTGWDRDELKKFIVLHVDRLEWKDGLPVRLYPFSRNPGRDVPRFVTIDPEVRFGRPVVKGAPTDVLAERWRAGDSPAYLAEDYNLTTEEVDEALRYESMPYPHPYPFPYFGW